MGHNNKKVTKATSIVAGLGLATIVPAFAVTAGLTNSASATGVSGNVQLNTEVSTSIAMKIASPNDTNPDCMAQPGVTYGVANRYATSNGAEGSKQVDGFDGTPGGADELNSNTSCATLTMNPNAFSSTYSDITIYTNSPNGYSLTVRSADNTSPNLVNTTDPTQYIPAAALTEVDGTGEQAGQKVVLGGQNKWALKSDTGLLDTWTPVATTDTTVRAYDQITNNGSNTRVIYGISSGNNPVGKYAATLSYTATMFDGDNPSVPSIIPATVSGLSFDTNKLKIPYGATRTITITPAAGHYLASLTCSNGFTCVDENGDPIETGTSATASQIVYVTNNSVKTGSGTIEATAGTSEYTVSASSTNASLSTNSLTIPYGGSATLTVTPTTGYYLSSYSCPEDYTCTKEDGTAISTGDNEAARAPQNIRISNDHSTTGGTLTLTSGTSEYIVSASATNATVSTASLSIPYGESRTLTVTPATGYYLSSYSCPEGYSCTKSDDTAISTGDNATAQAAQTIKVTNNNALAGGSLTFTGAKRNLEVAITPSLNATTSTNLLSIPYGGSSTFTITPVTGYYLTGVTCSSGYTCSGYSTGSASTPSDTSRGAQIITVTNNSSTSTGAVSFTLGNKYRIRFYKANIDSPNSSYVDVAYGGSATVTVTPESGYHLSTFSGCPSGWTCFGVSTGTSYTGAQTLTLTNNNSVNIGTLTMKGDKEHMQSFSCSSLSTGVTKTLRDSRDKNDYTVAKLKDGKCWMTQNLRLQRYMLKPTDSNVSSNFTIPYTDEDSFCTTPGSTNCDGRANVFDSGNASYGIYYNWYAATAGTGTFEMESGNATSSICPKGWRLPTNTEFGTMSNQYGYSGASLQDTGPGQPAFVLSGDRRGSSTRNQGSWGNYWSSTATSNRSLAYYLYMTSTTVGTSQAANEKYVGHSVRCVASS